MTTSHVVAADASRGPFARRPAARGRSLSPDRPALVWLPKQGNGTRPRRKLGDSYNFQRRTSRRPARKLMRPVSGEANALLDYERDPEADAVPGLTRDRNSRSEGRRSMCSAIHITSRTWLRPSSTREPSDPPLRVVLRSPRGTRASLGYELSSPSYSANHRQQTAPSDRRKAGGTSSAVPKPPSHSAA